MPGPEPRWRLSPSSAARARSCPVAGAPSRRNRSMSEFVTTTDLTPAHVARVSSVLEGLRAVPELHSRYAGVGAPTTLAQLAEVPTMTKVDLQTALTHRQPRAARGATWVFQSGGS